MILAVRARAAFRSPPGALGLLTIATLLAPGPADSQQPPGAGQLLNENDPRRPAAPPLPSAPEPKRSSPETQALPSDGPSFRLQRVSFEGNAAISTDELDGIAREYIGKMVTFADLSKMTQRINQRYREKGYVVARAILPSETIEQGRVRVLVLEGKLGKINVDAGNAPARSWLVEGIVGRQLRVGEPLRAKPLERAMLLLTDLPGVTAQSYVEAGEAVGASDLTVELSPTPRRFETNLTIDNHGSQFTGEFRGGLFGTLKSPLKIGDNLDYKLLSSSGRGLVYGHLGYELPVNYHGTRASLSYTRLDYELGERFADLSASGEAKVTELALTHPFLRRRNLNLLGRLSFEHKKLHDRFGAVDADSNKRATLLGAGVIYEGRDALMGSGYVNAAATAYSSDLDILSQGDREADAAPEGRQTNGRAIKIVYSVSRLHALHEKLNLYVGLIGQWANKNLDSSEKIALGGPRAVRAYAPSEALVDDGQIANLELRMSIHRNATLSVFLDGGWGRVSVQAAEGETENRRTLRAIGVELFWGRPEDVTLRLSVASPQSGPGRADTRDRDPRVYAQLVKSF
jgi:hemolysin activation/secretion protein